MTDRKWFFRRKPVDKPQEVDRPTPLLYEARRHILRAADQEQAARYWKKRFDEDTTEAIDRLKAENEELRKVISDSATACGATMSTKCTAEFMGHLPAEIAGVLRQLRAELERVAAQNESFADHMRALACRLGAGGYNAPEVDPDLFASKIHGGIDMLVDPLVAELEQARKDAKRYRWARRPESGNALFALVSTGECGPNIDSAIDAEMGKGDFRVTRDAELIQNARAAGGYDELSLRGWPERDDSPRQQRIEQGGELAEEVYAALDQRRHDGNRDEGDGRQ